jgi:Bifunctional DNA primase/polymerase, N-terminal/AAA domain
MQKIPFREHRIGPLTLVPKPKPHSTGGHGHVMFSGPNVCSRKDPSMPNELMQAALGYESVGFSIIPLKEKDKIPLLPSWIAFQIDRATREEIGQWWRTWPKANIGIVTGAVSGIVVIDADSPEAAASLKSILGSLAHVPIASTGKGFHLYFKHSGDTLNNKAAVMPKVDFRGDGGYVVAPPSVHSSGKQYEWKKPLNDSMPSLPDAFVQLFTNPLKNYRERFDTAGALNGVPEGQRDQAIFKLASKLRSADVPYDAAVELCEHAAANCIPPFSEARTKVDYVYRRYESNSVKQSQGMFWPEPLSAKEMINLPPDTTRWLWENCLPMRATSALIAKSYTGKTTFCCSLALSVARGIPFLGRPTQKGNVLYVYLDGPLDEIRENFLKIGMVETDSIFVYSGRKPDQVVEWVADQCSKRSIKLLVIDTAQKFFGFKEDKYEEKINKMQPILTLADEKNFHAMFTYHAAKNSVDTVSALGSVAAEANARVSLYLRRLPDSDERIFDTMQNSGKKFEAIALSDPADGILTKSGLLRDAEVRTMAARVVALIADNPAITHLEIKGEIKGSGRLVGLAVKLLKEQERIEWTGEGRKGSPRKYYLAGQLVRDENNKVVDLFERKKS